jgi:glycosyltransferase involved in cell wall biosynthesis
MRILYVVPFVPWPVRVRSYNLIPRLGRRHQIDLVCLARNPAEQQRAEAMWTYCESVRTGSYDLPGALLRGLTSLPTPRPLRIAWVASSSMARQVEDAIRADRPDVIYVERWRALQYVPLDVGIPVVCDPTDSMTLYNQRLMKEGKLWERPLGWMEYHKFRHYEARTAVSLAATVYCSSLDIAALGPMPKRVRIAKIVNGVNVETFRAKVPGQEEPNTIFFSGNFAYGPNRKAASFFLEKIFPCVQKEIPEARFLIVGNGASAFMNAAHSAARSVEVHNFVPDLQPYLASATVAVAPMRLGAGVSNKIMEAFSVGTSVVATPIACGDLPVRDGEHLLIADDADKFAAAVVRLLRDDGLRRRLVRRAQALVRHCYDWEVVSADMERLLAEVAGLRLDDLLVSASAFRSAALISNRSSLHL